MVHLGSGLFFDRCTQCRGVWLDAGEVEGFAFFVKNFHNNPPELTPELREKMDAAKREVDADYDAAIEQSASTAFGRIKSMGGNEDTSLVDDLLRGVLRLTLR